MDHTITNVTAEYRVDQYNSVYDENGVFFCKWSVLSTEEKRIVKQNPCSAK